MESNLSLGRILKFITTFAAIIVVIWLIVILKSIIALILFSAVIAYILDPVASALEIRGLSRTQATIVIFILFGAILGLLFYLLIPTLFSQLSYLQEGIGGSQTIALVDKLEQALYQAIPILKGQDLNLYQYLYDMLLNFSVIDMMSGVSLAVVIPFAVFFILKDGRKLIKGMFSLVPNKYFEMALNMVHKTDLQIGGYLRGQFLDSMIISLLAIIALWILDVEYYVLIGLFAGLANMIPYVGPLAGTIAATMVVVLNDGSGKEIVWVLLSFGIIQLIDNVIVQPMVLAKSVNLHPLVIIFAIITGGQFFGIIGMLVAIPVTGIMKVIVIELYKSFRRFNLI